MISIGLLIFHVDILVSFTDGLDQLKSGRFWTQVRLEIHTLRCQVSWTRGGKTKVAVLYVVRWKSRKIGKRQISEIGFGGSIIERS